MKRAVIIASLDNYANGVKPRHLREYLERRGFEVELLESAHQKTLKGFLGNLRVTSSKLSYIWIVMCMMVAKILRSEKVSQTLTSSIVTKLFHVYGEITNKKLKSISPDLVICEGGFDIGFVDFPGLSAVTILDLPCPLGEELFFGGIINETAYAKLKRKEILYYGKADALSFHWHTYADFVRRTKYNGENIIDMGYGTNKKEVVAKYSKEPRIIFLGLLRGYWVNIKLLEEIVKECPNVDVYGGPKPPDHIRVNYKGYAPTLDVMAEYQFGLITISDDELRKNSFSSKHLEYISYGLPVFSPAWRQDRVLAPSSIYFSDVEDLKKKIKTYSNFDAWTAKHKDALRLAGELSWKNSFKGLGSLLESRGL